MFKVLGFDVVKRERVVISRANGVSARAGTQVGDCTIKVRRVVLQMEGVESEERVICLS